MTRGWKDAPAPSTMMGSSKRPGLFAGLSNRLSSIATARVLIQMPQLDPVTEFARERVFNTIRGQLSSWLDFFSGAECFSASAARAIAQKHSADELAEPLNEFSSQPGGGRVRPIGVVAARAAPHDDRGTAVDATT